MTTPACGAFADGASGPPSGPAYFHPLTGAMVTSPFGCPVTSLHTVLPWPLSTLFTPGELAFDGIPWTEWAAGLWRSGSILALCAAYLAIAVGGRAVLRRSSTKFDLRAPLAAWNVVLCILSAAGAARLLPHLAYLIHRTGFYSSVCTPAEASFGHSATGFWMLLFVLSKVPELLDTAFIVLRRRSLTFLHVYHHVTVLLYSWDCYRTRSAPGLYFASVNFGVHALMYAYYSLQASGVKVPHWVAPAVTAFQISQMFLGIAVASAAVAYKWVQGVPCDVTDGNLSAALVMYSSYAALFLWFAVNRYCRVRGGRVKEE